MQVEPSQAAVPGRVLQVGPLYLNHVRRWSQHAAALGWRVSAAGHIRRGRRLTDLSDLADRVEIAPPGLWEHGTARRVAWLRDVIRRLEPDLIHAHWLPTWGCYAARAAERPVVTTPWGSDLYLSRGEERERADGALHGADIVIARSPHMHGELLARGVPPGRIHSVDLGVDLESFRPPSPEESARLRRELGLPSSGPVVLSFRAGTPLYNLDVVLEAFRIARAGIPGATLVVVHGDAPLSRPLRAALRGLGAADGVLAVGSVPHGDMPAYLRVATAGVSIPDSDGSPNSVWEALASGQPLVLSDLPQISERVGGSGAVRLVEPRPQPVASALCAIVADPRRHGEMSRAARAWAVANADQREQVERLGRAYAAAMTTASPTVTARPAPRPPAPAPGRARPRSATASR
jgi:glycosyltransferase involved in cell wall biosynthesis